MSKEYDATIKDAASDILKLAGMAEKGDEEKDEKKPCDDGEKCPDKDKDSEKGGSKKDEPEKEDMEKEECQKTATYLAPDRVMLKMAHMMGIDAVLDTPDVGLSKEASEYLGISATSNDAELARNYLDRAFALSKEASAVYYEAEIQKAAALAVMGELGKLTPEEIEKVAAMSNEEYLERL